MSHHYLACDLGAESGRLMLGSLQNGGRLVLEEIHRFANTPVASGDRLFWVSDDGIASCIEASSGKVLWKERLTEGNDRKLVWYGSPVLVNGRVYCVSSKGEAVVLAAADQFKILARNPLGEGTHSTPSVDGESIYFKTFTHLVCVGGK